MQSVDYCSYLQLKGSLSLVYSRPLNNEINAFMMIFIIAFCSYHKYLTYATANSTTHSINSGLRVKWAMK